MKGIKIEMIDGNVIVGNFWGETEKDLKIVEDSLQFIPKHKIMNIWNHTSHRKSGAIITGSIGLILGFGVGTDISKFDGFGEKNRPNYLPTTVTAMLIGSTLGSGIGYLSGYLIENGKLIWSRN